MKNVIKTPEELELKRDIIDKDFFLLYCKGNGLDFNKSQFSWLEKNGLITSLYSKNGTKFYSPLQLYSLDYINYRKLDSLDSNRGMVNPIQIPWQDYLLLSKDIILEKEKVFNKVLWILVNIQNAFTQNWKESIEIASRYSHKNLVINRIAKTGIRKTRDKKDYDFADRIITEFPYANEGYMKYWQDNFLRRAITIVPFIQAIPIFPALEEILKSDFASTYDSNIKLANFYLNLSSGIEFYLRVLTKKPIIPLIEHIEYITSQKRQCLICHQELTIDGEPDKSRKGGRPRKVCNNPSCQKEYHKIASRNYRKKPQ